MTNWQTKTIKDITTLIKDGTHGTHKDVKNGIPLLSAKDISAGKVNVAPDSRVISEADFNAIHARYSLKDGDILLTIVGSLGRVAIVTNYANNYTFQRSVAILRFNNEVDTSYAYYYLTSSIFQKELLKRESKGAQGGVYLGDISKIKINIPERPEQERIVGVLEVWDEYIEKLEQKIALKEQLKKGLMQQLLTGKRRLPGFSKEWKAHKLGDFLQEPVYKRENNPKDIELLTVRLHAKGVQATGKFPFATEKGRPYYRRFQGEILIGRQNFHNGGVGTVTKKTHGLIASNAISSYVPKLNANLDFMLFALQRGDFYKRIGYIIGGTGQKEISPSEFKKLKIIMPELEEQEAIASVLKKSNEELQTLYVYAKYINQQKQYLLKNLITGTIRTPEDLQPLDTSRLERSAL